MINKARINSILCTNNCRPTFDHPCIAHNEVSKESKIFCKKFKYEKSDMGIIKNKMTSPKQSHLC